jgi:tellurite methyltransferase
MQLDTCQPNRWRDYYEIGKDRAPRELYRQAVARFGSPGRAVDLGCGSGIEARDLLRRNWNVLAIDKEQEALNRLISSVPTDYLSRLSCKAHDFREVELGAAELVWAGVSLPFCPAEYFHELWQAVLTTLVPGGRFAGHFFGPRHYAAPRVQMTFHSRDDVERLCRSLTVEYFVEEEGERPTALDGIRHWHQFGVILQKR